MRITLNGESKDVSQDISVGKLLQQLELQPDRVAVEINLNILDRSKFPSWTLQEGDRIEIISFIGGGSPGQHLY